MEINDNFSIDVRDLDLKINWNQNTLKSINLEKDIFSEVLNLPKQNKLLSIIKKGFAWILLVALTMYSLAFIPITTLSEEYSSYRSYIESIFLFMIVTYSYFGIRHVKRTKKIESKLLLPLAVAFGFFSVMNAIRDTSSRESALLFIDLIDYITTVASTSSFSSPLIGILTFGMSLIIIMVLCALAVYETWVNTSERKQNNLLSIKNKEIKVKTQILTTDMPKWLNKLPYIKRIDEKVICSIESLPLHTNIIKLWKIINPNYLWSIVLNFSGGILFFLFGINFFESGPSIYGGYEYFSPDMATILSVIFIFLVTFLFLERGVQPFIKYYRLRELIIKTTEKKYEELLDQITSQSESTPMDVNIKLIRFQECLSRHRQTFILPIQKSTSVIFLLPVLSQIVNFFILF